MKLAKCLSVFFAVMAAALIVVTAIGYARFHQEPPLIRTSVEGAETRSEMLMEALCGGDYTAASESLYGNPALQWNVETASELGTLIWPAYSNSVSYSFTGPCYVTGSGVFRDVTVTALDIPDLRAKIQGQYLILLDPHLADAQYDSEAFDDDGNLRPDFSANLLRQAVEKVLQREREYVSHQITLELVLRDGRWWVMPTRELIDVVSGAATK